MLPGYEIKIKIITNLNYIFCFRVRRPKLERRTADHHHYGGVSIVEATKKRILLVVEPWGGGLLGPLSKIYSSFRGENNFVITLNVEKDH